LDDYYSIVSSRNEFNKFVYTPLSEAIYLLKERQNDPLLVEKIEKLIKGGIPKIFKEDKCGIMARQLATPNHENRIFINMAIESGLKPVFIEYFEDKFTANNKYKHSLGQLHIQNNLKSIQNNYFEKVNIIDFNKYNGKKIKEVKTTWGESIIDFHKNLFKVYDINNISFINEIDWYEKKDETPIDFYVNFFILITCFGILFENFLILKNDDEGLFTKTVILPALNRAIELTGVKPLIVPIEAIDLEEDDFWYQHLPIVKEYISKI
jgi:hypothetical protein